MGLPFSISLKIGIAIYTKYFTLSLNLKDRIITIKGFPKEHITFRDITPLLNDKTYYSESLLLMKKSIASKKFNKIVSPEARGFLFGCPLANELNKGFIPARKTGKLPRETVSSSYSLHYGEDVIHIHKDSINPGDEILIVDDVLGTGGTTKALVEIIEQLGGKVVGLSFLIELNNLNGRELLSEYDVNAIIQY
ncbi:adenine phosphoribosyltransferase [Piscibacillus sp. B03]|uniref:adenine phosphoribosyltransferase n=1 Tax=Piscibacillus sp. B03 TaxID=3457430 RepID=UPI003FCC9352